MRAIQKNFPNIVSGQMVFDEEQATRGDYQNMLNDIKKQSRSELKMMNQYGVNISSRTPTQLQIYRFLFIDYVNYSYTKHIPMGFINRGIIIIYLVDEKTL